jgi:UDP-galactose transporter B1
MRTPADKTPITKYSLLAGTYLFAMYCSNWAIQFVSFPTMVLAKSCKPIPVMIMGFVVLNKRPTLLKSICVFLIVVGISIFMLDVSLHNL